MKTTKEQRSAGIVLGVDWGSKGVHVLLLAHSLVEKRKHINRIARIRRNLSAPSLGDDLRSNSAICLRGLNCTQRFFEGLIVRPPTLNNCKLCPQACSDSRRQFFCGNDTVAVAMRFAMKNGQICFSLRKFLTISSAIQKIASDCGFDGVVHSARNPPRKCLFMCFVARWSLAPHSMR